MDAVIANLVFVLLAAIAALVIPRRKGSNVGK